MLILSRHGAALETGAHLGLQQRAMALTTGKVGASQVHIFSRNGQGGGSLPLFWFPLGRCSKGEGAGLLVSVGESEGV